MLGVFTLTLNSTLLPRGCGGVCKFLGGGVGLSEIPSMVEVCIFSGITHYCYYLQECSD